MEIGLKFSELVKEQKIKKTSNENGERKIILTELLLEKMNKF